MPGLFDSIPQCDNRAQINNRGRQRPAGSPGRALTPLGPGFFIFLTQSNPILYFHLQLWGEERSPFMTPVESGRMG